VVGTLGLDVLDPPRVLGAVRRAGTAGGRAWAPSALVAGPEGLVVVPTSRRFRCYSVSANWLWYCCFHPPSSPA